ncbi:DNA-binding protein WhiA [Eubacterium coprostanoligenes]|uniref:DNA-binding protein WhiA n=2 Tax=Eubacterium coprostanoligenes TaxID=290054 RepID=UPI002356565D|nr:DNA-binding protein WhiA [Eubacterium coprostanoligenes]
MLPLTTEILTENNRGTAIMSFSSDVKKELVEIQVENNCCKKSLLYGMALFSKSFSFREVVFQSKSRATAELYCSLLKELCSIKAVIKASPSGKIYTASVKKAENVARIMSYFAHDKAETSLRINFSNFDCEECQSAFLRGAFLACGAVSSPEKDYHLEFSVPYMNLSKSLVTCLQEKELAPKVTHRKGYNIIYFKDSEEIEDCLYIMGAGKSMFDMMNVKIVKEIRNTANRKANCDAANIEKTVAAASPQIAAIMKIEREKGLDSLSEPLRQMAEIRMENPDLSLNELAKMFDPPISRSGVNHRLSRLVKIAEEI